MEFHGAGLERMMEIIADSGEGGYAVFDNFAPDDLVGSLLLLYGLHPLPLEARVTQALDKVRPYLDSHGGNVELLEHRGRRGSAAHAGKLQDCPSSSMTLKLAIEEAIYAAAPDVITIEAEGVQEQPTATGFVQIGKSMPGRQRQRQRKRQTCVADGERAKWLDRRAGTGVAGTEFGAPDGTSAGAPFSSAVWAKLFTLMATSAPAATSRCRMRILN